MKKNLTMFDSGSCFILAMLAMTVCQTIFSAALGSSGASYGGLPVVYWIYYAVNPIAAVAVVAVFLKVRKTDFLSATRLNGKLNLKQYLLLPFISLFTIMLFLPFSEMFADLLNLLGFKGSVSVPLSNDIGVYLLSLLLIALFPAFGEELLLRGALVSGLKTRSPAFAVFISAIIFSLMHANAYQTVFQFGFGLVLCAVCLMSESLVAPIILHFLNNVVSLTVNAYAPQLNTFNLGAVNYAVYAASIIVGAAGLVFVLYAFYFAQHGSRGIWSATSHDGFSLYTTDESAKQLGAKRRGFSRGFAQFAAGFFRRRGRAELSRALSDETSYTVTQEKQCLSVYLALGFVALWWLINLIEGFL